MGLIERTIYPKLANKISRKELIQEYTPSSDELNVVYSSFKNGNKVFTFIVLLKVFKKLRYFPKLTDIPTEIIEYIKSKLNLMDTVSIENSRNIIYEYQRKIREQLSIVSDKKCIKNIIVKTVQEYEPIMEHPADIFNAVIETLIKNNCELPAFSTLERLINNKRTEINQKIYDDVNSKLTASEKNFLDLLLQSNEKGVSPFNYIKELPKSPTLKHMKEIKENYLYLKSLNYGENIIKTIHPAKMKYFSAQGNALDASEMKDFNEAKRYTILICFIYNCTIKTCDDLITMFIKTIGKIHTRAKEKLQLILEKQRDKTETIVEAFQGFLISSYNSNDSNTIADNFKKMIQNNGGYESLLKDCEEITAYNNNNYYPLLWNSFKNHRKTLFETIKMISISSTT
ncbi:DUF4158 domain-containing protein [Anaerophilus nitritogenes]|uniref:DUF4158 domain-containing protein n=1 Tax=Anaerophilus nitritogenes TaxID=2498136 RepID=UPI001930FF9B|nr:DUF4158 domain-containing protein [Anaerophilus nitritogenes]